MNKRAKAFQDYLKSKDIKVFQVEELKDDNLNSVVFRSQIEVEGQLLPTIVVLDDSVFTVIRVLVAPKVAGDKEASCASLLNKYNRMYKASKYYLDNEGNLVADTCLPFKDEKVDGDLIYVYLEMIINQLQKDYKELMRAIWA